MNQKLISGLTAALLTTTAIGVTFSAQAESTPAARQNAEAERSNKSASTSSPVDRPAIKLGEQQTPNSDQTESIAKIQSHESSGRQSATLYVRNIPVLTFVGSTRNAPNDVKMGEVQTDNSPAAKLKDGTSTLVNLPSPPQSSQNSTDPIARATAIAARLNQLYSNGLDANKITVSWKPSVNRSGDRYVIEVDKTAIVAVDPDTVLPNSTRDPAQDALQVTNRLRRLLGNASPLRDIQNKPNRNVQQISLGPVRIRIGGGMASWYGPGLDGNMSASGEVFNQNALTAAHRTLPFGTRVQVTNLDNGRSVIVRINDRGPFSSGRVIDLSAAAARMIGVMQSGVAPVRLEVLDRRRTATVSN